MVPVALASQPEFRPIPRQVRPPDRQTPPVQVGALRQPRHLVTPRPAPRRPEHRRSDLRWERGRPGRPRSARPIRPAHNGAGTADPRWTILGVMMDPTTPTGGLDLALLPGRYAVCRLDPGAAVPAWAWSGTPASVTRTDAELSIICAESAVPATVERVERGWRAVRVTGPLDFNAVGVMARLTAPLAAAGISILALATFDTDYVLVREPDLARALAALRAAGHHVGVRD